MNQISRVLKNFYNENKSSLFRDADFATFWDGISGNWILRLRDATPIVPEISLFYYSLKGRDLKWLRDVGTHNSCQI